MGGGAGVLLRELLLWLPLISYVFSIRYAHITQEFLWTANGGNRDVINILALTFYQYVTGSGKTGYLGGK